MSAAISVISALLRWRARVVAGDHVQQNTGVQELMRVGGGGGTVAGLLGTRKGHDLVGAHARHVLTGGGVAQLLR